MTTLLFRTFFRLLSLLPLSVLHFVGALLGRLIYATSAKYAERMRENLAQAAYSTDGVVDHALLNDAIVEAGKSIAELPWIWGRRYDEVLGAVVECHGTEHLETARASGKGILFLTPHLGCFEIASLYMGRDVPMTALYRQPRLAWLEEVMCNGRARGQVKLAKADMSGVRLLYKALRKGEAIGLLPDQVPSGGDGEWVDFFGRPAYTMTLAGRLAQACNAEVLLVTAERQARGYVIHVEPLSLDFSHSVPQQINTALERWIRQFPAQYLWSYNRYKVPRGVEPPVREL